MRQWFVNLSARAKLSLAMGLMVFWLAAVILAAYASLATLLRYQSRLFETEFANATDLLDELRYHNAIRAAQLNMLVADDRAEQEEWHQEIKTRSQLSQQVHQRLLKRNQSDPALLARLSELISTRDDFTRTLENQIVPLIRQGKTAPAKELILGVQMERFRKIREIVEALEKEASERAEDAVRRSGEVARRSMGIFVAVGLVAVLVGILLVALLNRLIAGPLKEISNTAAQIASGNLSVKVLSDRRADEVGVLTQTFSRMTNYLTETAKAAAAIARGDLTLKVKPLSENDILGNAFAAMVENLRRTTAELTESVNVLGSCASEILAVTTQVGSGAVETATAVSETTTTVEEVKQTSQLSNQKAKYVLETAQKSAEVAQTGRKSVETSVERMKRIQEQMESIAESIVRLSEQSQAIGEIIATVNDLAEQSNLLAVNAAIEAAKAGEQGKGFAVVAQEIKTLAEQSKQATAQVRTILGDIQKATSAAVLATEQGSKAVEAGVRQSTEAGESIRALADSIAEAAQAATQIAASSQQQLAGMDQVALAMENIKQASAQNVAGTKQAETAAHNLNELGQRLKQMVERYRL